jgi:dihydrofolate reductase
MRRIAVFEWMTADGYFGGADGNLNWVIPDQEQASASAKGISGFDTVLLGRRTYEMFAGFWPHALDDDDGSTVPDPHNPGRRSREHRVIAVALNEMTKLVFSRTLKDAGWKNSRIIPDLDPQQIETMKTQSGKDMIVFGSGSLVTKLTEHGLIDEYELVVCPVFLGSGRSLLGGMSKNTKLDLRETRRYQSGDVMHRYVRAS